MGEVLQQQITEKEKLDEGNRGSESSSGQLYTSNSFEILSLLDMDDN